MFAFLNRSQSLASNRMVAAVAAGVAGGMLCAASAVNGGVRGGEVVVELTTIDVLKVDAGGKLAGETKATVPVTRKNGADREGALPDAEASAPPTVDEPIEVCIADVNSDGLISPDDMDDYLTAFFGLDEGAAINADLNRDGIISPDDLDDFITAFFDACCLPIA